MYPTWFSMVPLCHYVPLLQVFWCVLVLAISSSEVKKEDPTSKMLLSAEAQEEREVETRLRSVKLLEQCVMIAKRTVDDVGALAESPFFIGDYCYLLLDGCMNTIEYLNSY